MRKNSLFGRKLQLAFGSAVLVLCAVGALSYRTLVESTESDVWVRHTHDVLEKLQDSLAAMQTVESNARGSHNGSPSKTKFGKGSTAVGSSGGKRSCLR